MGKFKKIAGRWRGRTGCVRALAAALFLGGSLALGAPAPAGEPAVGGILGEAFTWLEPPAPAPRTVFKSATEKEIDLGDFRGQVVLLNFWATWCAPCIREMPALDRLQAALGDEGLEVVAVSEDFAGRKVVEPFFAQLGLAHLKIYYDSNGALSRAVGVNGLPTTFLIDREGRIVGGLEGPAEWDSDESIDLIRHYLDHPETT
jgi:thiol-disulfide isomerase/thioredoxin